MNGVLRIIGDKSTDRDCFAGCRTLRGRVLEGNAQVGLADLLAVRERRVKIFGMELTMPDTE